ncbi:MAG TPA: energy-dependent translational throttle protein EttA [Lentisphaeria bacterium]|nr:MAG: energy-dependent translational throttle protein EttA [Lentisphaerae bacterium GWF2_50_93]HCE42549.1 energy-dependent translational throttle protein EttA [Lentisphaeria bacterium]
MPPHFVFQMMNVSKFYNEKPILQDISLSFYYGAKIGIVGENGSGKSTLLRIMAGVDTDIMGTAQISKNMRVCYVPQEPHLNPEKTVRGNLEESVKPIQDLITRYDVVCAKLGEKLTEAEMTKLGNEMDRLQTEIDNVNGWELDRMLDMASDALLLPPDDADVTKLSGGEGRRVALCKALLEKPDLLLLDEPTNHLDAETVAWLEQALREYPGTVIIVTHDRYFLDNITKWILELENTRGIPFEGNYSSWLKQKSEILRVREKSESNRQKILKNELDWISSSPLGRIKKQQARISRYEELSSQQFEVQKDDCVIQIPPGPHLGNRVVIANSLTKGYDGVTLLDNVDFNLPPGGIVGIVGPNGAGKTTLFRMIVGQEKPDSGTLQIGDTVKLAYVDQHRDSLDGEKSIYEEITGGLDEISLGNRSINGRAYCSRFNFRGTQQQKKVGQLSGGERNRVHLAKLLRTGGNMLLLDEPTNDLDVNTMRVLEEALIEFPGCAMVISHDRFFLDRICTHLLIFEGDGKLKWFEGNFQAYEEKMLAADSEHLLHRRKHYKRLALK